MPQIAVTFLIIVEKAAFFPRNELIILNKIEKLATVSKFELITLFRGVIEVTMFYRMFL